MNNGDWYFSSYYVLYGYGFGRGLGAWLGVVFRASPPLNTFLRPCAAVQSDYKHLVIMTFHVSVWTENSVVIMSVEKTETAIVTAAKELSFPALYHEQKAAITSFVGGNDVFVSLPTGYGKT